MTTVEAGYRWFIPAELHVRPKIHAPLLAEFTRALDHEPTCAVLYKANMPAQLPSQDGLEYLLNIALAAKNADVPSLPDSMARPLFVDNWCFIADPDASTPIRRLAPALALVGLLRSPVTHDDTPTTEDDATLNASLR